MDNKKRKKTHKLKSKNSTKPLWSEQKNGNFCPQDDKNAWITLDNLTMDFQEKKYVCTPCGFKTKNKSDFFRHKKTKKHAKKTHQHNGKENIKSFLCLCGKRYKYNSGLSKHKKNCEVVNQNKNSLKNSLKIPDEENEITQTDNSVIKQLLEQNKTLIEKLNSMASEPKIVSYQNCGNKKMTVNLYLNQTCKDAMNLSDFVENLKISLEDLDYTKEHGFVKGISNIFVKHLADLNPTLRPIHCSDTKRLQFYVKDENKWEKDQQHEKLDKSIHDVTIKQIKQLHEWEKENPHYLKDDKSLEEWQKMVHAIMGGGEDNDREVNKELIKKKLSATTEIKDDMITIKND